MAILKGSNEVMTQIGIDICNLPEVLKERLLYVPLFYSRVIGLLQLLPKWSFYLYLTFITLL